MPPTQVMSLVTPYPSWRHWVEPWYLAYAILGATAAGIAPMVLPLAISRVGTPTDVGLVMAAVSLGGVLAPLWGRLADRYRLHRGLLVSGLGLTAVGLAAFPFATTPTAWLGLALLQGIGAAGTATVANLFVVEVHPQDEWDTRIGWLQTFHGGGQMAGLLLVAGLEHTGLRAGLLVAAGVTALAMVVGWRTTPLPPQALRSRPVVSHPVRHGEWAFACPQHHYHHPEITPLRHLRGVWQTPLGRFLALWLVCLIGSSAFFALYPVLMHEVFGVSVGASSAAFALIAGLRLLLYAPAGHWSQRFGPVRVLWVAFGVRWLAFLGVFVLGWSAGLQHRWLAMLGLLLAALPWSLLSVSSTALTARLSPRDEGEGMGWLNAVSALAGVLGAALGGWSAERWGYNAAAGLAVAGLTLGMGLALFTHTADGGRDAPDAT